MSQIMEPDNIGNLNRNYYSTVTKIIFKYKLLRNNNYFLSFPQKILDHKNDKEAFGVEGGETLSQFNPITGGVENLNLSLDNIEEVDENHRDFEEDQFVEAILGEILITSYQLFFYTSLRLIV